VGAWQVYETIVDADCPQQEEFEIVRCVGHQHIGARCITLFNAETNEKICQSCPVYGKKEGALFCDSVHRSRVHAQALTMCVRRGGCHLPGSAYLRPGECPPQSRDVRGCVAFDVPMSQTTLAEAMAPRRPDCHNMLMWAPLRAAARRDSLGSRSAACLPSPAGHQPQTC